jgi:hypothetical protein
MRISNPRTFAGDLPLATREYVNVKANELSGTINSTAVGLSAYIDNVSGNIHDYIDENVTMLSSVDAALSGHIDKNIDALSGHIDKNRDEVKGWLQGTDENSENHKDPSNWTHGYAWLNPDGKIDPSLMPPISLTNVITINQFMLITETIGGISVNDSKYQAGQFENGHLIVNEKDGIIDQFGLVECWLRLKAENGGYKHPVQTGDMIIVTYSSDTDIPSEIDPDILQEYTDFYRRN